MADNIQAFKVTCSGGLNTNRDLLSQSEIASGSATQLINYEPSINGGYRKINGYSNEYGTVPGTGKVFGVCVAEGVSDSIFAARSPGDGTGYLYRWDNATSDWIKITTPALTSTGVVKVRMIRYNLVGAKIVLVDGVNPAAIYDGTSYTQITHAQAPSAPKYAATFKNHLFLTGDPSNAYNLYFSAPYSELDFSPATGAGVINVGFDVVQIKQFRDSLYIFGKNEIKRLSGNSSADFILEEVTHNLGCIVPDSVVELAGDIIFLGPDGFRPIAGTSKIGDVQLETISKEIQFTISSIYRSITEGDIDPETFSSIVVRKKSQFRMLSPENIIYGILGGLRNTPDRGIAMEFGQIYDMVVTCADSGYVGIDEVVIHGTSDGKVMRQEVGTSFNGNPILSVYQTPHYYFGDPTIRKNFYNITTFLRSEGLSNIVFSVSYDFEDSSRVYNPENYEISTLGAAAYYNDTLYDAEAVYDGNPSPLVKTNFSGSGFSVAFKYVTNDIKASHTIQGFVLNYAVNDRR
jgi:hypothetical protein